MTISSKPNDSDILIERRLDVLGNEVLVGSRALIKFFDDLVQLFNIDSPDLSSTESQLYQFKSQLQTVKVSLKRDIEALSAIFVTTAVNHETLYNEIIECTAAVTVTLNPSPRDLQRVTIKRNTTAGFVVIDGNGKTIDGASSYTMQINYEGLDLVYSADSDGWLII